MDVEPIYFKWHCIYFHEIHDADIRIDVFLYSPNCRLDFSVDIYFSLSKQLDTYLSSWLD